MFPTTKATHRVALSGTSFPPMVMSIGPAGMLESFKRFRYLSYLALVFGSLHLSLASLVFCDYIIFAIVNIYCCRYHNAFKSAFGFNDRSSSSRNWSQDFLFLNITLDFLDHEQITHTRSSPSLVRGYCSSVFGFLTFKYPHCGEFGSRESWLSASNGIILNFMFNFCEVSISNLSDPYPLHHCYPKFGLVGNSTC